MTAQPYQQIPRGRAPKPVTSRVTWVVDAEQAESEAKRIETDLRRVAGQTYWQEALTNGRVRFTMQVPTRDELNQP